MVLESLASTLPNGTYLSWEAYLLGKNVYIYASHTIHLIIKHCISYQSSEEMPAIL